MRARLPRLDPLLADGLVALVAAGLAVAQLQEQPNPRDRSALNIAFVLLQTLPLVFRRRLPFTVFAVGAGSMAVQGALGFYSPTFAFLALNVALYSLAAYGDRQLAILGVMVWAGLLSVHLTFFVATSWPHVAIADLYDLFNDWVLLAAAWILGQGVRQRRAHAAELEDRAMRLEREREEQAKQAAIQERLRIARELHDVVAHSLSVIGIQAGAARLVLDADPDPAGPERRSPPSRPPPTGRWPRCAAPWAFFATPNKPGRPWPRCPAWTGSPLSWTRCGRPGWRWT